MTLMETVGASRCAMALMVSKTHELKPLKPFQVNEVVSTPLTSTIWRGYAFRTLPFGRGVSQVS